MSDVDIIINVATQGAKSITDLSASLRSLNKGLVDLNIPLKKLDAHSQAVAKAMGVGARSANDHAKTLKGLITNQKALGAETRRIRTEIGAYRAAISFAGTSNKAFADSARKAVAELKQMDRALRGMRIRAFGSDLRATATRIQKIGKDAQFVGRSLMINLTAPIALFARTGFQLLLAVDKELVRLTKVLDNVAMSAEQANRKLGAGASPKQVQGLINAFNSLNNELTKISSNYGVSKQLIVGLASDFAELGINGHESILALTELTAQIEKLGAMDISGAQDLTQALYFQSVRAYENTGAFEGMTRAIDREALAVKAATTQMYLFNAIENVTALTLKDLGQAFPEVASMAVSFGLSMTEAAALLAPMKAAGLDVGASANSIKVSLQRALSPTTKNIKILEGLAESFGEAGDKTSAFATASKTGLTGLQSITEIFDKVMASEAGMEGAMKLMSNLFEKRQGPRMFLAIEQLSLFNKELNIATRGANTAEGMLAGVAESALREFNALNKTALPETVNNFKDIGIIARIATAHSGQMVEGFGKVNSAQIKTAKEARKAVADRILLEKQTKGRDVVSEVRTETGRAMIVQLAGASNAAEVANAELGESLKSLSVVTERLKNNFKLFAADILKAVIPTLKKLSDKVQELMDKWNNSTEEFRERVSKVVTAIATFLAALGPVVLAIGTMQAVTGVLGRAIAVFIPKLRTETGAFVGLGHAIQGATASLSAHTAAQNKSYLGAIKNKLFGKADMRTPADALKELTAASRATFGTGYKPIEKITAAREAKILNEEQFKAFQRLNPSRSPVATQQKLFKESKRISEKIATSGAFSLTPKEAAFQARHALKVASIPTAMGEGTRAATPIIARKRQIFDRSDLYARKGIMTDADGSRFFSKSGREISEKRAGQLATGRFFAPVTDPLRSFGQKTVSGIKSFVKDPGATLAAAPRAVGRSIGRTVTGATTARAAISAGGVKLADKATDILGTPGKVLTKATDNAKQAITKLNAQYALFGQGAPSAMTKAKTAMMAFGKSIKSVTVMMKVMKLMFLTTGIGAVLAVIGIAIYTVMKNMDSFKKGAKPLLDALSTAFGQIKQAIILTIQPIMELFGAFGSGGSDGMAAAEGIGAALAKLAGVVEFVSKVIQNLLLNVVKPVFSAIANIVMAVVSMFKGNWGDAFNYLLAALGYVGKAFINIWKVLADVTISIIAGIVKGGIKLFFNLVNGLAQMVISGLKIVVSTADGILGRIGLGSLLDGVMGSLDSIGGKVSRGISTVSDGIQGVVDKGANLAKKGVGKIAEGINSVLDKVTSKGLKSSITKNKKAVVDAGTEVGEAGGEAIANAMGDAAGKAGDKAGKAIKDGIKDAAQRLQDYVRDAFKSALEKMIDATVAAMKKQKDAGLKVFDVQLKTLEKLEKAEESLTKTKEYQQNLRKILDDRDLNRANYIRNRALAIYEGRVDDARMLDLEQQGAEKSSIADEASLADSRRKDLAAENLAALREAIAEAKEKAGELFDLQIEAFQKAAADIIKIGPVTIEQYAVMQKELETLANTSSSTMNQTFGEMFEKFVTTIGDKMPNQVVGAFSTSLDLLVAEARAKYGLGEDASENTIIGVTLGMLTSIGDKMGEGGPAVVEAFGAITTDLHSNFTEAKDALLLDVQEAFLVPFKKAFDEADPTAVFQQAIKDGNLAILRDFENTLELNKALMDKMVANLDPAIKKYIELKAAIDAANDAAAGGAGGGAGATGNVRNLFNPMGYKTADSYLTNIALQKTITPILNRNAILQERNQSRRFETNQARADIPRTRMATGGYIPAPTQQGVPAILHGGEYVLNAKAVNRIGIGALEKMNNNLLPRFYKGGRVPGGSADTMERRAIAKKYSDNFVEKAIVAATTPSNIKKLPGFVGGMVSSVAQSFNTAGAGLLNVVGSVAEVGKKGKSYNPLTNYARRQEAGKNAPLNPARGLGFQDKSGMFNIAKDSYLGAGEAFDVVTSFPILGAFGKAAGAAARAAASNAILRKIGAAETGLSVKQVVTPAVSALLKRNVGSTVATQITSQVAKEQFKAQEILNQLPRQLSAGSNIAGENLPAVIPKPLNIKTKPVFGRYILPRELGGADGQVINEARGAYIHDILGEKIGFGLSDDLLKTIPDLREVRNIPLNPVDIAGTSRTGSSAVDITKGWLEAHLGYQSLGGNVHDTYVSALLYAASAKRNLQAQLEYIRLVLEGRKTIATRIAERNREASVSEMYLQSIQQDYKMKDLNFDKLMAVHETSFPFEINEIGDAIIRPTSDHYKIISETGNAAFRDTVHFALNHVVKPIQNRASATREQGRLIAIKLQDLIDANPKAIENIMGVDTYFTPKPGEGIRFPAGKYEILEYKNLPNLGYTGEQERALNEIFARLQKLDMREIFPGLSMEEAQENSWRTAIYKLRLTPDIGGHGLDSAVQTQAVWKVISEFIAKQEYWVRMGRHFDDYLIGTYSNIKDIAKGQPFGSSEDPYGFNAILYYFAEGKGSPNAFARIVGRDPFMQPGTLPVENLALEARLERIRARINRDYDRKKIGDAIIYKKNKLGTIPLPAVGAMDPALEAKKAAFLQARGMGGSGAAFNNIQQFLDSIGDRDNIFGQLRNLTYRQQMSGPSLTRFQQRLIHSYTTSGSGAVNFQTMRQAFPDSIEFAIFKQILEERSKSLNPKTVGPLLAKSGVPLSVGMFSGMPVNEAMRPFIKPEVFEELLRGRLYLDMEKHLRSPADFAEILNIVSKELQNVMDTHGTTLTNDMLFHRGLGLPRGSKEDVLQYIDQIYNIGKPSASQFRSTSVSPNSAMSFTSNQAGDLPLIPVMEHIIAPKGSKIFMPNAYGFGFGNERELIIPPNYRFVPTDIKLNTKYRHIDLAEIYGKIFKIVPAAAGGVALALSGNTKAFASDMDNAKRNKLQEILDLIATGESSNVKNPYEAFYKGRDSMMEGMTAMSINDVLSEAQGRAVGKYQFMPRYMLDRIQGADLTGDDLFSSENQEKIMTRMFWNSQQQAGLGGMKWLTGKVSTADFVNLIANTFRGMPQIGGEYVGGGENIVGLDPQRRDLQIFKLLEQLKSMYGYTSARLPGYKSGGYIPGSPSMPFPAMLHGGEYVINADAVRNMGVETMRNINQSKFRTPSGTPSYQGRGQATTVSTVNINVDTFIGEEEWFKGMMKSYNINVAPRVNKATGNETRSFTTYNGLNQ